MFPFDLSRFSYMNCVQTTCPHILRYITAAAIISKRRKNIMKELVKIIQQVGLFLSLRLTWAFDLVLFTDDSSSNRSATTTAIPSPN